MSAYIHNDSQSCEEINIITTASHFYITFYRVVKKSTLLSLSHSMLLLLPHEIVYVTFVYGFEESQIIITITFLCF